VAEVQLTRILASLAAAGSVEPDTTHLCTVCADISAMSGAGILLIADVVPQGALCSSDSVSRALGDLQSMLGEGPGVDAHTTGGPVFEPDLAAPRLARWLAFSPAAVEAGARAVFGFPLHVGAARLGALDLYRDRTGPLDDEQRRDTLLMADVAARAVLLMQAGAPPGLLAAELEDGTDFQFVVHQASGMVAVQLGVSLGDALVRLRAHAYANGRHLTGVATDVVNRQLQFRREQDEDG
jgi:hypothetical protein